MDDSWRLFIAIELPDDVIVRLGKLQESLKHKVPSSSARWVKIGNIHLTLKFLGDVSTGAVDDLKTALDISTHNFSSFDLTIQGTGCFPNPSRPRVLWAGVKGNLQVLNTLHRRIEQNTSSLDFPPENKKFSPHLTLARAHRRASSRDLSELGRLASGGSTTQIAQWHVTEISLIRSQLKPSGAVYTCLHTAELKP